MIQDNPIPAILAVEAALIAIVKAVLASGAIDRDRLDQQLIAARRHIDDLPVLQVSSHERSTARDILDRMRTSIASFEVTEGGSVADVEQAGSVTPHDKASGAAARDGGIHGEPPRD